MVEDLYGLSCNYKRISLRYDKLPGCGAFNWWRNRPMRLCHPTKAGFEPRPPSILRNTTTNRSDGFNHQCTTQSVQAKRLVHRKNSNSHYPEIEPRSETAADRSTDRMEHGGSTRRGRVRCRLAPAGRYRAGAGGEGHIRGASEHPGGRSLD